MADIADGVRKVLDAAAMARTRLLPRPITEIGSGRPRKVAARLRAEFERVGRPGAAVYCP